MAIYLRECFIENAGPITNLNLSLQLNADGTPKPVVLVGMNGSGKTWLVSQIADALIEAVKPSFGNIVENQQGKSSPFFKVVSTSSIQWGQSHSFCLFKFYGPPQTSFAYIERSGDFDLATLPRRTANRFDPYYSEFIGAFEAKHVAGDRSAATKLFNEAAVCFFPASRHERPHWFNPLAQTPRTVFGSYANVVGTLAKPFVVESTAEQYAAWLMDVMLDSYLDFNAFYTVSELDTATTAVTWHGRAQPTISLEEIEKKATLQLSRRNVENLLRKLFRDESAELSLNDRSSPDTRLAIKRHNGLIPSIAHMSAGESLLFNMFVAIIRYADRSQMRRSMDLKQIEGIVLVDEIDAHLHTTLQYDVLPSIMRLFPRVQFIVTAHAPLFVLGMEKAYGGDGIQIIDMPEGNRITTERYSEFLTSLECYKATREFENHVEQAILQGSRPLVFTEGPTDAQYLEASLELLGHKEMLDTVEIRSVGTLTPKGTVGSGKSGLDTAKRFLEDNPTMVKRRVLLLYDCDTKKENETRGRVFTRMIPRVPNDAVVTSGIENLLPAHLMDEEFVEKHCFERDEKPTGYKKANVIWKFLKQPFCTWVLEHHRTPEVFAGFCVVVEIIRAFLAAEVKS